MLNKIMPRSKWMLAAVCVGVLVVILCVLAFEFMKTKNSTDSFSDANETGASSKSYPLHQDIITTVFWAGENADSSNDFIHNRASAWTKDWVLAFGGIDDPAQRCGYKPCGFEPKENTFYFALPMGDYDESGLKSDTVLKTIPWYDGQPRDGQSILKNRWIEISYGTKTVYAQWQDVGPFYDDDSKYVFGNSAPKEPRAGLDVSPAVRDYLGMNGRGETSWRFIEEENVPEGPWSERITRSGTSY